jgi:hypothetical protein
LKKEQHKSAIIVKRRAKGRAVCLQLIPGVSWLEIGISQISGNKLMILKPKLPIETDNRATVGVPQEMMFYDTSNLCGH